MIASNLVSSSNDVRARIKEYNRELQTGKYWTPNTAKGTKAWNKILPSIVHWVYDPETDDFGPSKFVGYRSITLRQYLEDDSYRSPGSAKLALDGRETTCHIRRLAAKGASGFADTDFIPLINHVPSLQIKFSDWANRTFPPHFSNSIQYAIKRKNFGIMRLI